MPSATLRPLIVALGLTLLSTPSTSGPRPQELAPAVIAGQSATLLPDGRWLLVGGQDATGHLATLAIWDSRSRVTVLLPATLHHARAWHSATLLADGTVLVFGGIGADGQVIDAAELVDPDRQTLRRPVATQLTARAWHTGTVLTDGRVLIAGGMSREGETLATAEIWNAATSRAERVAGTLTAARSGHSATVLPDGAVLLRGGIGRDGHPLDSGEWYDPDRQNFTSVGTALPPPSSDLPALAASLPEAEAVRVPLDTLVALRFSLPLRVETVNSGTVMLVGPAGPEPIMVIPAEGGRLAFLTPETALLPGTTYTVSVNGPTDPAGHLLPFTTVRFTTDGSSLGSRGSPTRRASSPPESTPVPSPGDDEDGPWSGEWRDGRPYSRWQSVPALTAPPGVTAIAGQILMLNGEPLPNVTLRGEAVTAQTDAAGRFLVAPAVAGWSELLIDGRSASTDGRTYGVFEVGVRVIPGQTNVLPYTIWMPRIDTAHAVTLPTDLTQEFVVTSPRLPGLEVHLPAHSVIRDHEGNVATQVSLTPIPTDRPPFSLPDGVDPPVYFTIQPGAGYVHTQNGTGARLVYPNYTGVRREPPGARFNFWHYDAGAGGWYVYGQGAVTADGRHVVPAPGVAVYEFTGAMIGNTPGPPAEAPAPGSDAVDGEPVDLGTGLFVQGKTDLFLPDVMPLSLTRTYRTKDTVSRDFGIGATHAYNMYLYSVNDYQDADLILPDGGRIHYVRISPGTGFADAVYEHTGTPTRFFRSRLAWNGTGWTLTLKEGTTYHFPESCPGCFTGGLQIIRDRAGNTVTISRGSGSPLGNITRVTSPNGRSIQFTYDAANRVTQAKDSLGRIVAYSYDAAGRLATVTDPAGGVTSYTYDTAHRMLALKDARGIVFLTNAYDTNGRVSKQTQADSTTYRFAYTVSSSTRMVTQTDVTDPRGNVRRVTFNAQGYPITDTRAQGTSLAQTATYERQPSTNLILSVTDALARKTVYAYDAMGNLTRTTRLAGTAGAVTTTFAYEPAFNQVATVTDPLGRTTTFGYDAKGNLTTITNPLGQQTTLTYDSIGQPLSVADPVGQTTRFAYAGGDLAAVTDPLGNRTTRSTDGAGRLTSLTDARGRTRRYEYDALNRLTMITDPRGGTTTFVYDANGNLLSLTDARGSTTTYTYDTMDRLTRRTDPLLKAESYQYDAGGNVAGTTDRKGQTTAFTYDALNRQTRSTFADKTTLTYTYDQGNRITTVVDSKAGTVSRAYDGLDRIIQETAPQGTVEYTYDAGGRRATMTAPGQATVGYSYDAADRLTGVAQGTAAVAASYDAAGRRTTLTLPNAVTTRYAYDAASQVTTMTYERGATLLGTLTYAYDAVGNRTEVGGTWARTGLPEPIASASYNAANQQLVHGDTTLTYDANGSVMTLRNPGSTTTFTWNARNQLTGLSGGVTATFVYDGLGRREKKTVGGTLTEFLFDGPNPVRETAGATMVANLLTGIGVDEYFTRTDSTGDRDFLTDALGSTVALTDPTGTVQTSYTYQPFGAAIVAGSASANPFQYTGRENDGTGLYYYRARYYHPALQRFVSEDPMRFRGSQVNLYAYARNNPTAFADPLGLRIEWGNYALHNPLVIGALYHLNQAIIGLGIPDDAFTLRVTGGDRYRDCAGRIRSATTRQFEPGSSPSSPHLFENGARAVDLHVAGVSDRVFDIALTGTDFLSQNTERGYADRHTHIALPRDRRYFVPPDSLPPWVGLDGRYDRCGR